MLRATGDREPLSSQPSRRRPALASRQPRQTVVDIGKRLHRTGCIAGSEGLDGDLIEIEHRVSGRKGIDFDAVKHLRVLDKPFECGDHVWVVEGVSSSIGKL